MSDLVSYNHAKSVGTVTLDDGKANALSPAMLAAINEALDQAETDGGVVVIRGRHGLFSGGFDLKIMQSGNNEEIYSMLRGGAELAERLLSFPQPTLAACTGHGIAMGFFVLLSCDYRIGMDADHKFAANEVAIGMTLPHFAVQVSRQRLTPAAFNRGLALAHFFSTANAVEVGALDEIVPPEEFDAAVTAKAQQLAELDMASHTASKLRMRKQLLQELRSAIEVDCAGWEDR